MPEAIKLVNQIKTEIVNPLIGLLFAIALVYFLWGVFQFITKADDGDKAGEGKKHMVWGLIGMFIMFSAFGIMSIIGNFIGAY